MWPRYGRLKTLQAIFCDFFIAWNFRAVYRPVVFLKNYTSAVPVSQTIYRIEQVLIQCGVNGITKEYGNNGIVTAITFHLKLENGTPVTIRLPADKERALDAL